MNVKDLNLTDLGDLEIIGGDFNLKESDQTHIEHLLISNKGNWFESPLIGVGLIDELKGSKTNQELKQDIRRQLTLDNFSVKRVDFSENGEININANRKL
jgi:hypothetical protein